MNPFTFKMLMRAAALKDMANSIHRRNWRGNRGPKINTCRAPDGRIKAITGLTEHLLHHPNDAQSVRHLAWLKGEVA